jgi:signal transduction histidine kinase
MAEMNSARLPVLIATGVAVLAALGAVPLLFASSAWSRAGLAAIWLAGIAFIVTGSIRLDRKATARHRAAEQQLRRAALLADAAGSLTRLRDPVAISARAEALARRLLACDEARIVLGPAAPLPAGRGHSGGVSQTLPLLGAEGSWLGQITLTRQEGPPFDSEDRLTMGQLAGCIGGALEAAGLLAEAVQAKAEVELILGTISDGMFVLDPQWNVRYANNAALRYLGRPREQMLGAAIWDLFPGLEGSEFAQCMQKAARSRQDVVFTAPFPPLDAWYEARCYPFDGGLTVYFRDVTAQRDTEDRLRQSQKLEALGQLTGGIAHDVNNLLTVILGNLEMLALSAEERGEAGAPDFDLAQAGLRAGANASQLMRRLLAFSRRQPLSPQTVDVGALLTALEPLLRRSVGETAVLGIGIPAGLWRVLVDPAELENALINLAINARDAMPAGGQLNIEASNVTVDRVYAAVTGLDRCGDFVMISVSDNGIGMPPDVLDKAFEPFFTTKQPGKGTGLGLSMVYGFARQSGGHVMIHSEAGQGTIIRLYLPRTVAAVASHEPMADDGIEGGSETILLVEDNELVRAHTAAMLRGLGYIVFSAADGPAALDLLRDGLLPDLLLTDVVLPGGMSGRQVADAAAHLVPQLRVLFTSGYPGSVLLEGGRLSPGVELISKPFRRSELAARVRAQLAAIPWRNMPRSPLVADAGAR